MSINEEKLSFGGSCGKNRPVGRLTLLNAACALRRLNLLEEIVPFVIHRDKRREIFHFNFPDGFHPQFGIFHALQTLDTALSQHGRWPAMLPK